MSACSGGDTTSSDSDATLTATTVSTTDETTTESTTDVETETETGDPTGSESESDATTEEPTTDGPTTEDPTTEEPTTEGPEMCGNGVVEGNEACDDGNDVETDECLNTCEAAACGDGVVQEGVEDCDDANDVETDTCLNSCVAASCGDSIVWEGTEECDDGNDDDLDGCSNTCTMSVCGDGVVTGNETCDDENDIDTDACTNTCAEAVCGDAIVWEMMEECDDGGESEVCDDDCTPSECGDGVVNVTAMEVCDDSGESDVCDIDCTEVECGDNVVNASAGEQCDDGNNDDDDGCSATCESESKYLFVTSEMYTGDMGGLAGADQNCQTLAEAAGLPGTYLAWLSTANESPNTRFTQSAMPYIRPDGQMIANNWADLTDGNLLVQPNVTEQNTPVPIGNTSCAGGGFPTVWSHTNANGNGLAGERCGGWTNTQGGASWGRADTTNGQWSSWCSGGLCSWLSPIYCVQQ
ncbi:MAG: DUF4215 domain-containing protein [Nannocystaceae bacterium]